MGHVVLGAIGVAGAGFELMSTLDQEHGRALLSSGVVALFSGATVLAGLWIKDGRWHGALLAAVLGLARLALLLLTSSSIALLDLLVTVALLGGALWILPELRAERPAPGRRAR